MHKGKNLYSEQEAVIMGFIKELKEEFEIIKERDPASGQDIFHRKQQEKPELRYIRAQ